MWGNPLLYKVGVQSPPPYPPGPRGSRKRCLICSLLSSLGQLGAAFEGGHTAPLSLCPTRPGPRGRDSQPQMLCIFPFFLTYPFSPPSSCHPSLREEVKMVCPSQDPGPILASLLEELLAPNQRLAWWLSLLPRPCRSPIRRRLWCHVPDQSWHSGLPQRQVGA